MSSEATGMSSTSLSHAISFLPNYRLATESLPSPLPDAGIAQRSSMDSRAGSAAQSAILAQLAVLPSLAALPAPPHPGADVPWRDPSLVREDGGRGTASRPDVGRDSPASALDIVQSIMKLATRRPKDDIPLLPPEHYHVNPAPHWEGTRSSSSQNYCAGCSMLQGALTKAEARVQSLEANQLRLLRALTSADVGPQASGGDPEALLSLLESRVKKSLATSSSSRTEDSAASSISAANLLETLAHVNTRLTQLETDLEVSVSEMQKVEANLMTTLESVHQSGVSRSEFAALATEWSQSQRNDALELYHDLISVMGIPMASLQEAAANPRDLDAIEALWRSSHIGRSVAFLQPHDVRARKRSVSANTSSAVPEQLGAAPALDSLGVMPLYARMLGVLLVDEPFAPGVRVREVLPNSNGAASGLRGGDYLTSVNRIPVRTCQDMIRALTMVMPGSVVKLRRLAAGGRSPEDIVEITAGSRRVPLS